MLYNNRGDLGFILDQNDTNRLRSHSDWHWIHVPVDTVCRDSNGNIIRVARTSSFLFDCLDTTGTVINLCIPAWGIGRSVTLKVGNLEYTGRIYGPSPVMIGNQRPFTVDRSGITALRMGGVKFSSKGNPFPIIPFHSTVHIHEQ